MIVEKNKTVSLCYVLTVDEDVIETVTAAKPMNFIVGTGYLLPEFEKRLIGRKEGASFSILLYADEAYGQVLPEAIVELPKSMFAVNGVIEDGLLEEDSVVPMSDSRGNPLQGIIDEVRADTVIMNFNHPLAGEALQFQGFILSVRDSTPEELRNALPGKYAPECGSDGDGCNGCTACLDANLKFDEDVWKEE